RGERLEAELRREARVDGAIGVKALGGMPDVPIVQVSARILMPPIGEIEIAERGRRRPEAAHGILVLDYPMQQRIEAVVIGEVAARIGLGLWVPAERADDLVVAAPEGDRGVVAKAAYLLGDFGLNAVEELPIGRIAHAGEHEVVPDQDAELVAEIVEIIRL